MIPQHNIDEKKQYRQEKEEEMAASQETADIPGCSHRTFTQDEWEFMDTTNGNYTCLLGPVCKPDMVTFMDQKKDP